MNREKKHQLVDCSPFTSRSEFENLTLAEFKKRCNDNGILKGSERYDQLSKLRRTEKNRMYAQVARHNKKNKLFSVYDQPLPPPAIPLTDEDRDVVSNEPSRLQHIQGSRNFFQSANHIAIPTTHEDLPQRRANLIPQLLVATWLIE